MLGGRWIVEDHEDRNVEANAGPLAGVRALWVAWEKQRRTTELARSLELPLYRFLFNGPGFLRYPVLAMATLARIRDHRAELVVVQNPSLVLALVAGLARPFLGYRLVVDRHTNFMINKPASLRKAAFTVISDATLRLADFTVVTNQPLAQLVNRRGGRGFVLPDRIPEITRTGSTRLPDGFNVAFICTYAGDEPYVEVARAAMRLPADSRVYITGRARNASWPEDVARALKASEQIVLTDFLPEPDYENLLLDVDVVVDLTTMDHCLVCGAYEGIAAGKPLVLSDKQANRDLFGDHAVYVDPTVESILDGLLKVRNELSARRDLIEAFKPRFESDWWTSFNELVGIMRGEASGAS